MNFLIIFFCEAGESPNIYEFGKSKKYFAYISNFKFIPSTVLKCINLYPHPQHLKCV